MSLPRWLPGAALCLLLVAAAAYAVVRFLGLNKPEAVAVQQVPAMPAAPSYRVTPESEIITEMKEEPAPAPVAPVAEPAAAPVDPTRMRPAWAASAVRPAPAPRRAAASTPKPVPAAPAAPVEVVRAPPPPQPVASAPVAARPVQPAELCAGQSGIAQALCLSRECANPAVRGRRQCAAVREAEQRVRERMELGG